MTKNKWRSGQEVVRYVGSQRHNSFLQRVSKVSKDRFELEGCSASFYCKSGKEVLKKGSYQIADRVVPLDDTTRLIVEGDKRARQCERLLFDIGLVTRSLTKIECRDVTGLTNALDCLKSLVPKRKNKPSRKVLSQPS